MATKTVNCTLNGHNNYNNGWGHSIWLNPANSTWGAFGYGKHNSSSHRAIVLKITTPAYTNASSTKSLTISIPLCRTNRAGSDNWHCAISTTAPNFSNNSSAQIPSTWVTTWNSIQTTTSYAVKTFGTGKFSFKPNTVYYLWLYSDTPVGTSIVGCYSHNHSSVLNGADITVTTTYEEVDTSNVFTKALNPRIYGKNGSYSGCQIMIDRNDEYPDIFVGNSTTGIYYRRDPSNVIETEEGSIFSIDASTSVRTLYITRRKRNSNGSSEPNAAFNLTSAYYTYYQPPMYACEVYCHSSMPQMFYGTTGSFSPTHGNTMLQGLTTNANSASASYASSDGTSISWTTHGANINGKSLYGIYLDDSIYLYVYRGGTEISIEGEYPIVLYGINKADYSDIDGGQCESDSSYSFIGWSPINNDFETVYENPYFAIIESPDNTIYGVYKRTKTLTYYTLEALENGSLLTSPNISKPWREYYCGKGASYVLFYDDVREPYPTERLNWKLKGWSLTNCDIPPIYDWHSLIDVNGGTPSEIYACYMPDNTVSFGASSEWKNVEIYYGVNGVWKPIVIRYGVNGKWNGGKVVEFTLGNITYQVDKGMTWAEWCHSGYNSSGFKIDENSIKVNGAKVIIAASGEDVLPSYTIVTDQGYYAFYEENNQIEPDLPNLDPIT